MFDCLGRRFTKINKALSYFHTWKRVESVGLVWVVHKKVPIDNCRIFTSWRVQAYNSRWVGDFLFLNEEFNDEQRGRSNREEAWHKRYRNKTSN